MLSMCSQCAQWLFGPLSPVPVIGDVQVVLHENLYVNEDPVGLEILGDVLFVLSAVVLLGFVRIGAQLLQDGHPFGKWS